ncbi:DUF5707 domain-containing protein [Streptomyces sp. NBC_00344]|uniref:DUF5707 domain-containing protein n=1 Tax=Streptomyces sp. NBC_00344 TaxID=2975720 RepID=UPI002E1AEB23
MRIRATVAAVTGALALSALVFPAVAQADETPAGGAAALSPLAANTPANDTVGDTKITNVVVNGGKDIVLGTTVPKTISVSVTATDSSGIQDAYAAVWHGTSLDSDSSYDQFLGPDDSSQIATCTKVNATTSTCTVSFRIDPRADLWSTLAGTWKVSAAALGKDGDYTNTDAYKTVHVQRASRQTVNAAPEPVKKGGTITVTGKLDRANWDDYAYHGYTVQPVKLQFRKKNSSTYTTVKTLTTNSTGNLKTTVKAVEDGYWRYNFAGTTTTPAAVAAGDFVDVK